MTGRPRPTDSGIGGDFDAAFRALAGREPAAGPLSARLLRCYDEPHRAYHTRLHLGEAYQALAQCRAVADRWHEVEVALWFHDAIYDVSRKDNEAHSADWARDTVLAAGLPRDVAARVHALVMSTQHDPVPPDTDAKIVVDVDLSILGAPPARFDEYERQVREEYSAVPEAVYRAGRARVLRQFLERPAIFNTARFVGRYERQARANLQRSIAKLGG